MAKLTLNESPTTQLIAKAAAHAEVTDSRGRVFRIAKPGILAQFRIIEVMGKSADIETFRGMVTPLIYIAAIDGDEVSQPINRMQLDALIQRVGDDGLEAVVHGVVKHFGKSDAEAEKAALKK